MLDIVVTEDTEKTKFIKMQELDDIEFNYSERTQDTLINERYNAFFDVSDRYGRRL